MSVIVFTGPTFAAADGAAVLEDAVFLPPVAQGDVYRATLERPWAIGIIDGYFERMPAVWHKEILCAMSQGIHVFGSASMGALRAAELHAFGMVGVGVIFEAYHQGALTDDDEVAIVHGPAEDGYRALSDAMVNLRATLDAAVEGAVLRAETGRALAAIAKRTFYAQRSFQRLLVDGAREGLPEDELGAFQRWLPEGRVDQKRRDAVAMLEAMAAQRARAPAALRVAYHFSYTDVWDQVSRRAGRSKLSAQPDGAARRPAEARSPDPARAPVQPEVLLDELRIEGSRSYGHAVLGALARALAVEEARRQALEIPVELFEEVLAQVRREKGLLTSESIRAWVGEQRLDVDDLTALIQREARLRWVQTMFGPEIERLLPDQLRMMGRYGELHARAQHKQQVLTEHGLDAPSLDGLGIARQDLVAWYFAELGRPVPSYLDGYAVSLGLDDGDELLLVLARERWYRHLTAQSG
ncbi:TfuA-like protein [Sorangium sp. So ce367]|uniref:TfuA-like protein n=1 Tax=Sorangium sp. So ce367 TaxID=3133305 RepID=UPI003F5E061F